MKPRIIVCGLGRTGYRIFNLLRQQGADVVGVSDRPIPGETMNHIIVGDLRSASTLITAGIREAHTLVLAGNDDALNLAILTQAKVINNKIRIINRLLNHTLGERLDQTVVDHVSMSVAELAAPIFTFAALGNKAIGQLRLFNQTWPIHEEIIHENHPWLGRRLSDLWESRSRMLIYFLPTRDEVDLISAVMEGKPLEVGDHLIVGTQPTVRNSRRSWVKQLLKAIANLRKFQEYGRPVALVTLALLLTIFLATLTYVSVNFHVSVVDALYFSVGMITGAGGKEEIAENAPDSIKIFTSVMMIVGAGVIGICYALINDFILGSRLRQFWAVTQVPSSNHYVVCGLGGIGVRIVQQLLQQGHDVVVIERDANNRYLHTARSLGVPVIIEDASISNSLREANVHKARALLAVTSNDMVNVEIALCAKAISPRIAVVVRNHDVQFSVSVQQVFEFESVLCPTELATPSFAAAALGGRILGNGITDDLLWVALATLITPHHPFYGKTVKEAAVHADFVPLYLESQGQTIHGWRLLETPLQENDVLYLTMPATELEQLWRSDVPSAASELIMG
ncbi:NAD-binding protein [Spirulina subsalsa FACHB-351]|uniref:NAD-binding protein n=1 Tax=Spirulina subsalsa FACHB-351 TaxID=234711 RepID=A0ABT3L9T6_9CYAN|nr:NAD-binding protein [Spirulina subsalsa]MCW6038222.1 NAD-binding protein [Spirulina subsalsa FACHB-351]